MKGLNPEVARLSSSSARHLRRPDCRGLASKHGLVRFLDAADAGEHWFLVAPLSQDLLPFARQRVRARELVEVPLPGRQILIVENDRCLHLLPSMTDAIAVLGAGLNLGRMGAAWLHRRDVAYRVDMDTWGLQMLAHARRLQPQVDALLMNRIVFDAYEGNLAVGGDTPAPPEPRLISIQRSKRFIGICEIVLKGGWNKNSCRRRQ